MRSRRAAVAAACLLVFLQILLLVTFVLTTLLHERMGGGWGHEIERSMLQQARHSLTSRDIPAVGSTSSVLVDEKLHANLERRGETAKEQQSPITPRFRNPKPLQKLKKNNQQRLRMTCKGPLLSDQDRDESVHVKMLQKCRGGRRGGVQVAPEIRVEEAENLNCNLGGGEGGGDGGGCGG